MTRLLDSVYTKILFGSLLAFAGVAGGIYLGFAITGDRSPDIQESRAPFTLEPDPRVQPIFELGDLFPLVDCTNSMGDRINFEEVMAGKPTAFLFVIYQCEPCYKLLQFWLEYIDPIMNENAQVVICVPDDMGEMPPAYAQLSTGITVINYDKELFQGTYNVVAAPTIITVDQYAFIQHIQTGFHKSLDYQIYEDITMAGR